MSQIENEIKPNTRRAIYVRATGAGSGGIATLVLDGEDLIMLVRPVFRSKRELQSAVSGDLFYGRLVNADGKTIDEVVLAPLGKKHTATGNEQIEISCHGGAGAIAAVEEALNELGISPGRATELLERAHLNGKLSLVALEARLRLAHAATARQAEFLLGHTAFQQQWERLGFDMALGMRQNEDAWRVKMLEVARASLESSGPARRLLKQHHVAIIGPVNAGKSTLANAIARAERHIISDIPGTTLDRLDTPVSLRGLSVLLTDTAGLRDATDPVEREGQSRGWAAARDAALRLVVLDGSRAPDDAEVELLTLAKSLGPLLIVLNKQDLGINESAGGLGFVSGSEICTVSAQTGLGLEDLASLIESQLLSGNVSANAPFTQRQQNQLLQIQKILAANGAADDLLPHVRKLIGTRPDADELNVVLADE